MKQIIIHISGASDPGKSFVGQKLNEKFKDAIVVRDLGELWQNYISIQRSTGVSIDDFFDGILSGYQTYIDDFIKDNNSKPIIFIGINVFVQGEKQPYMGRTRDLPNIFFDLHADYKFYIDMPINKIIKQNFNSEFSKIVNWLRSDKEYFLRDMLKDVHTTHQQISDDFQKQLFSINPDEWRIMASKWSSFYSGQNYVFLPLDKIYDSTVMILNKQDGGLRHTRSINDIARKHRYLKMNYNF